MMQNQLLPRDVQDDGSIYVGLELLHSLVACVDFRVLLLVFANKSTQQAFTFISKVETLYSTVSGALAVISRAYP